MTPGTFLHKHSRQSHGATEEGCAKIRAYTDSGVTIDRRTQKVIAISWRETFILEVQSEHHGTQHMKLSILELHTLWRLIGRAMKWRREPRA